MSNRVLFIDDQLDLWENPLREELGAYGFEVVGMEDPARCLSTIKSYSPHIVLLDIMFPGGLLGKSILEKIKAKYPNLPVVMITTTMDKAEYRPEDYRLADYRYAKAALADGDFADLAGVLLGLLERTRPASTAHDDEGDLKHYGFIVGQTPEMRHLVEVLEKVASSDVTVLITGETGTGKELLAKAIHNLSPRRERRFVTVVCSAIPQTLLESELFGHEKGAFTTAFQQKKGKLEYAEDGTIFLDEIGELHPETQIKLLHFLQERQFERVGGNQVITSTARIIAATNRDLHSLKKEGRFREDLYYRLNVVGMKVPPLRKRLDDLPPLFSYLVQKANERSSKKILPILREDVKEKLQSYSWPGNIRELENAISRAVTLADENILQVSNFSQLEQESTQNNSLDHKPKAMAELILKGQLSWVDLRRKLGTQGGRREVLLALINQLWETNGSKPTSEDLAQMLRTKPENMRRILMENDISLSNLSELA